MKVVSLRQTPKRRRKRRSERRLAGSTATLENRVASKSLRLKKRRGHVSAKRSRITGALVFIACLLVLYWFFNQDAFYVYTAQITGNHILSAEEIYRASGIDSQSVFWINPKTVKARLEAMNGVKTAHVKVTLPAHISIEIEERQPEIAWQTGGQIWWVDKEGTFIRPRSRQEAEQNRLLIVDQDNQSPNGKTVDLAIIRAAQLVHQTMPDVKQLAYSKLYGLIYYTPENWPVYLGKDANVPAKLAAASAVRTDLLTRGVNPTFIDARNPLRVVYEE